MGTPTPIGQRDDSEMPRYGGIATYALLPRLEDVTRADVAVLGVPFDSGTSFRPGARFGPAHIRENSRQLHPYHQFLDVYPFGRQQVADAGDVAVGPYDMERAVAAIERAARSLVEQGTRVVALGGDHTVALPLMRAAAAAHGPLAVLHFDAHLDTWDTCHGASVWHGSPFRRAAEEGIIDLNHCQHVGTRGGVYDATELVDDRKAGFERIDAQDFQDRSIGDVVAQIRRRLGAGPVYVSVDIDVLDPAHAPATGTPEVGGLTTRELLATLRGLAGLDIVGCDIVEVAPAYDHADVTGLAAAHTAWELISLIALGEDGSAIKAKAAER
ncbi:agmatinase [Streptacidiphilus jiangxiensis]|uniref:Agmatinase n=1 Tax=Streptacidiphilus jiangxiensis TaxID=235985 RepID=A0A1H7TUB4_STRJI|nr:agmatinase [Streptacidiphilus jiangxiensis]SEL88243.1 agmatinase [Streptacidiphilus jiangxiensis]